MNTNSQLPKISIAPMMDWTDRHYRYFMRLITKHTLLYTEMITTGAILHGDRKRFLAYSPEELPLAIQLGGDKPEELALCAKIAEDYGYSEVNLNVGCPSDKVQNGNFGACLMANPDLVAKSMESMKKNVGIPVTIKHRIGIDSLDTYEDLKNFVSIVSNSGCDRFIIHARIAILKGLSPAENRTVPPLRYGDVYRLKKDFPDLTIEINGGITDYSQFQEHFNSTDGIMIGRKAYEDPYFFSRIDSEIFGDNREVSSRKEVLLSLLPYLESIVSGGGRPNHVLRHIMGLFHGVPGARSFRRYLSENMYSTDNLKELLVGSIRNIES